MSGTVVHANPAAGSYALALSGGELVAIHAAKLPRPGAKLRVPIRRLANGTLAEAEGPAKSGTAARAAFDGTVTWANPDPLAPAYTVSWLGASILVQVPPDPTGTPPVLPALGSYVTVEVAIEPRAPLRQIRVGGRRRPAHHIPGALRHLRRPLPGNRPTSPTPPTTPEKAGKT